MAFWLRSFYDGNRAVHAEPLPMHREMPDPDDQNKPASKSTELGNWASDVDAGHCQAAYRRHYTAPRSITPDMIIADLQNMFPKRRRGKQQVLPTPEHR